MQIRASVWSLVALLPLLSTAAKNPKRGICFADNSNTGDISKADQTSGVISWVYDWGTSAPSYLASSGLQYVPMQWGASGANSFAATIESGGAKTILVSSIQQWQTSF